MQETINGIEMKASNRKKERKETRSELRVSVCVCVLHQAVVSHPLTHSLGPWPNRDRNKMILFMLFACTFPDCIIQMVGLVFNENRF